MHTSEASEVDRHGSLAKATRRRIERFEINQSEYLVRFPQLHRYERLPLWVKAAFLCMVALCLTAPTKAAESDRSDPNGFDLPTDWGTLPAPTSEVNLRTPTGLFKFPLGYYYAWWELKKQEKRFAPEGNREFAAGLAFSFVYPGGEMTSNPPWDYSIKDRLGHLVQGKTAVFIDSVDLPNRAQEELIKLPNTLHTANFLVRNTNFSIENQEGLSAFTTQPPFKHKFSVMLICVVNCSVHIYSAEHNLVLSGFIDGKYKNKGLSIADDALTLLGRWRNSP